MKKGEEEAARISSNVGELDDISRLKEKEGYPAPPIKVEPYDRPSASKSRSPGGDGSRFGPIGWQRALAVIAVLSFISFMIYAFYPRSYDSKGMSVDELQSRIGRASRFSIEPNQFYEYGNGALSYYANLKRADSASSTSILVLVENLNGVSVMEGPQECANEGEYFKCLIPHGDSEAHLNVSGQVLEESPKIMLFERACDSCNPYELGNWKNNILGGVK